LIFQGKTPVALAAGYIDKYSEEKERTKVIVVVTEDFTVSCFDASLTLLWEKSIAHKSHTLDYVINHYTVDEAAIFITPLNLKNVEGGPGAVVIGASLRMKDSAEGVAPPSLLEAGFEMGEDGDIEHPEIRIRSMLEHFSVYALDAKEGHVIWRHDGSDVKAEQYTRSLPYQAYHLDSFDLSRMAVHGASTNMNDWSLFKSSMVTELPHYWHDREDTNLRFAHFIRRHLGAGATQGSPSYAKSAEAAKKTAARKLAGQSGGGDGKGKKDSKSSGGDKKQAGAARSGFLKDGKFNGIGTEPLSLSATLPHDASEHTDHPNVLVAHTKHGLEIISLTTGVPITSMALNRDQVYGDVDGDGVVDSIIIIEKEHDVNGKAAMFAHSGTEESLQHCTMMVVSGLPPRQQLFNGTVCLHRRALSDPMARPSRKPPPIASAPPLIVRNNDPKTNVESKKHNVVVATNMGMVTSYMHDGEFDWQSKETPTWEQNFPFAALLHFDADASRAEEFGSHDNAHSHLLVLGDKDVTVLSRRGEVMSTKSIPKPPICRPVIGDFDGDGFSDVIIVTEDALLGYRLEVMPASQGLLAAFCVLAVISAVLYFMSIRVVDDTSPQKGGGSSAPGVKRKTYSLIRSTDETHID
jgi:hypothetical protein